jgi:ABC-type multidrug transport system ATPase subunit
MEEEVIVTENLTKHFGKFVAVNQVNFSIPKGSIFGFLGPNGSGKSTVIRMLCGILTPTSGKAKVLGYDITQESEKIRSNIGYMSQKFSLYTELSVHENITFYARLYGVKQLEKRRQEVIELVGIQDYLNQIAGNLSGGWKQRLALACSLIHSPQVIFLDEPTAGIDPVARRKLWGLIFQLSGQGITFFVTTHYMDEAERCTQVGYIYLSNLIVCGMPEDLKSMKQITPEGYKRMEIICDNITQILYKITSLSYIQEPTIFGQAIHLLVKEDVSVEKIKMDLQNLQAKNLETKWVRPTLEDVFVRLTSIYQSKV